MCEDISGRLKKIQLTMLREYIEICRRNHLKYFLVGGSALGAVRHKGFIPWDDDIDVAMPREDYEIFLHIAPKELSDSLFLQCVKTDHAYPLNFAKIRKNDTAFIELSLKEFPIHHGVYIDIFPLDGVPKRKSMYEVQFFLVSVLSLVIGKYFFSHGAEPSWKGRLVQTCGGILFRSYQKPRDLKEALIKKYGYHHSAYVINYCGAWGKKECVPRDYFGNGATGEFEGIEVSLPEQWDLYLKSLYGDYMTLPPEEKRVGHHDCSVIDLERSYLEYI